MKTTASKPANGFHAGQFLNELLERQCVDAQWLADRVGQDVASVDKVLGQADMDAERFVRYGQTISDDFFSHLETLIFAKQQNELKFN